MKELEKSLSEIAQDITIAKAITLANQYSEALPVDKDECMYEAITIALEFKSIYKGPIEMFEQAFEGYFEAKMQGWICNELHIVDRVECSQVLCPTAFIKQIVGFNQHGHHQNNVNMCQFGNKYPGMIILEVGIR
jgi:hypothetical protein